MAMHQNQEVAAAGWYASLTGPLLGWFYELPFEELVTDKGSAQVIYGVMLNTSKLASLWCAVYTWEDLLKQEAEGYTDTRKIIQGGQLDYQSHEVSKARWAVGGPKWIPVSREAHELVDAQVQKGRNSQVSRGE